LAFSATRNCHPEGEASFFRFGIHHQENGRSGRKEEEGKNNPADSSKLYGAIRAEARVRKRNNLGDTSRDIQSWQSTNLKLEEIVAHDTFSESISMPVYSPV
jgi:hypothetical protein